VAVAVEHATVPTYAYYGYANVVTELTKLEHGHVEETLARAKAVATEADVRCEVVHANGSVSDAICEIAASRHARLIIIGAHGWGPVRRLRAGSVSSAVLHEAPCPVLVVRSEQPTAAAESDRLAGAAAL